MTKNSVVPFSSPTFPAIVLDDSDPGRSLAQVQGLNRKDVQAIGTALTAGLTKMAVEYVWSRSIARLTQQLSSFGAKFIGEMLDRPDIPASGPIDQFINNHDVIFLATELGLLDRTGAMRLKQSLELISHFSSIDTDDEASKSEYTSIIENCLRYCLNSTKTADGLLDFKSFRDQLGRQSFADESPEMQCIKESPYFYKRTTIRTLLSLLKSSEGASRQHVIYNLSIVLPMVWNDIAEDDRYSVGRSYAEAVNSSDTDAVKALKRPLSAVKGFDYVPENVRSNTFRAVAKSVKEAHSGFNNFHNEPAPTVELAKLGTVIPKPALSEVMSAYLVVAIGNRYGVSRIAEPVALGELKKIPIENWQYYIFTVLPKDRDVLWELQHEAPAKRFIALMPRPFPTDLPHGRNDFASELIRFANGEKWQLINRHVESAISALLSK